VVQDAQQQRNRATGTSAPRTIKQHLRTLFLRGGIQEVAKRVKLSTAMFIKGERCRLCVLARLWVRVKGSIDTRKIGAYSILVHGFDGFDHD
jgi:hypothetical protein